MPKQCTPPQAYLIPTFHDHRRSICCRQVRRYPPSENSNIANRGTQCTYPDGKCKQSRSEHRLGAVVLQCHDLPTERLDFVSKGKFGRSLPLENPCAKKPQGREPPKPRQVSSGARDFASFMRYRDPCSAKKEFPAGPHRELSKSTSAVSVFRRLGRTTAVDVPSQSRESLRSEPP